MSALGLKGQRQPDETQASHHAAVWRRKMALPVSVGPDVQEGNKRSTILSFNQSCINKNNKRNMLVLLFEVWKIGCFYLFSFKLSWTE